MELGSKELGRALKRVRHAASKTEPRFTLIWVDAGPREKTVRVVAADNFRLAVATIWPAGNDSDVFPFAVGLNYLTPLLYFLAAAEDTVKLAPAREGSATLFWDSFSAITIPNALDAGHPVPDWRPLANAPREHKVKLNLTYLTEAVPDVETGQNGWLALNGENEAVALLTEDYQELIMPLRVTGTEKLPESFG